MFTQSEKKLMTPKNERMLMSSSGWRHLLLAGVLSSLATASFALEVSEHTSIPYTKDGARLMGYSGRSCDHAEKIAMEAAHCNDVEIVRCVSAGSRYLVQAYVRSNQSCNKPGGSSKQ